jgi:hypothetical protein
MNPIQHKPRTLDGDDEMPYQEQLTPVSKYKRTVLTWAAALAVAIPLTLTPLQSAEGKQRASRNLEFQKEDLVWLSRKFQDLRQQASNLINKENPTPLDVQLAGDLSRTASKDMDYSVAVYTLLDIYAFVKEPRYRQFIGKKLKDTCAYYSESLDKDSSVMAYIMNKPAQADFKRLAASLKDKIHETRTLFGDIASEIH